MNAEYIIDIMAERHYKFTRRKNLLKLYIQCYNRIYENLPEFHILLKTDKSAKEFLADIKNIYEHFDISKETYKNLDEDGHGISPEPYDMADVYAHYKNIKDTIGLYYSILNDIYNERTEQK